jgi:hypothetical protein
LEDKPTNDKVLKIEGKPFGVLLAILHPLRKDKTDE